MRSSDNINRVIEHSAATATGKSERCRGSIRMSRRFINSIAQFVKFNNKRTAVDLPHKLFRAEFLSVSRVYFSPEIILMRYSSLILIPLDVSILFGPRARSRERRALNQNMSFRVRR